MSINGPLRVGIGGPVGSGKTALMENLCKMFRDRYDICAITNDIYTKEDALILTRAGALPEERIMGVETGGCPHTAIREDASINLAAVSDIVRKWPDLEVIFMSGYTDDRLLHQGVLGGHDAYLQKPFSIVTLADTIRRVLDGPDACPAELPTL